MAAGARSRGVPILPGLLVRLARVVWGADLPAQLRPRDVVLMHNGLGVVIHPDVVIEGPAIIFHEVTLGNAWAGKPGAPHLRPRVMIGSGAKIIGPVTVGPRAIVGAGAVVTRDVPPGMMAVGNPARMLPIQDLDAKIGRMFGPG